MKAYTIFISSPGDVRAERELAVRVIARVNARFGGRVKLQPYLWEHEPMLATRGDYQENIPPTRFYNLVVCILWSRLGSRLHPGRHQRHDGSTYSSGTEYEFETAVEAHRLSKRDPKKPELLIYRKLEEPKFAPEPRDELDRKLSQWDSLQRFCEKWFKDDGLGTFKLAVANFNNSGEFELQFEEHLRKLVIEFLEKSKVDGTVSPPERWWQGSPYRGLQAFHREHEKIFFGRTRATDEVLSLLRMRAAEEKCPFVMIFGASGSGKSSLMRAGVLPWLIKPGVIDGIEMWRHALFRPAEHYGDLLSILAATLVTKTALPELLADGSTTEQIAEMLREEPKAITGLIKGALSQVGRDLQQKDNLAKQPLARLALAMDQLEEVFTLQDRFTAGDRRQLFRAISALVKSGYVWVISTLRSDFFSRCEEVPELIELTKGRGQYRLLAPTEIELSQMIRYPAEAAGVLFEEDANLGKLEEVIAREAHNQPGALPLLEYALELLYEKGHTNGILTHKQYEEIGRVTGAVAQKAEETFKALPLWAQESLDGVLRQLILLGDGNDASPTRRIVLEQELTRAAGARELVTAFIDARLFTTDRDGSGQPTVTLAHEALLKLWDRVVRWIDANRNYLRQRGRLASSLKVWEQNEKHTDYLLPAGLPLVEAETLLNQFSATLVQEEAAYITASRTKALRAERRNARIRTGVIAGFTLLGLVAGGGLLFALTQLAKYEAQAEAERPGVEARAAGLVREKKAEALDAAALLLQKQSGERLPKAGKTWTNSLGLRFVPAGTDGVLFCVYDVRVKDYQQFVTATGTSWPTPDFGNYTQSENDPAVDVSWNDAEAFCQWLTKKDQAAGVLGPNQKYRLPTDDEWSRAAGSAKYPWGDSFPPPLDAGNYCRKGDADSGAKKSTFDGTDGYGYTSPAGQFQPNSYGLYDMGGNVWQWCDDWYDDSINAKNVSSYDTGGGHVYKVVRGASWLSNDPVYLLSACRLIVNPTARYDVIGFRLVVVAASP